MNIRVPYENLGNIKSYKFVSLILDKNKQSIYRQDIINTDDEKFFSYELPFMTVPDELYDECDSVIFFPFIRDTNNWGTRVVMWKDQEFIKLNGGYEFVRNSEKVSSLKKIDEWLETGKNIKKNDSCMGEKNLIYFTIFGNKYYIKLLEMLINTLDKQSYKNFDILFITDSETAECIKDIKNTKKYTSHFYIVETITDPVDASMQKLKIYNWSYIFNYKNILFLDADVLVVGDVGALFCSEKIKNNVFYSAIHNKDIADMHKTVYHSLIDYTTEQLSRFEKCKITAFNAGQFFFRNTHSMKSHFDNINNFILNWDGRYFFEQSFLNYYFNLLEISDTSTFDDEFQFVSINENETNNTFNKNAVFVHFMGNATNGEAKIDFIKKHYGRYVQI